MDIRHPMGKFDQMMLDYCGSCHIPLHILLNKADKLSRNAGMNAMHKVKKDLQHVNATCQLFSALNGTGLDEAREKLAHWLFGS